MQLYAPSEEDQAAFKSDSKWCGSPADRVEQVQIEQHTFPLLIPRQHVEIPI
jgi:hypothetical protein